MTNFYAGLAQHNGGRTIFFGGESYRPFHSGSRQIFSGYFVMQMDFAENAGYGVDPFRAKLGSAAGNLMAAFFKYVHNIESRTAANPQQYHFHGPNPNITAAVIRGAVHHHGMAAAGFADKGSAVNPFDCCLHVEIHNSRKFRNFTMVAAVELNFFAKLRYFS